MIDFWSRSCANSAEGANSVHVNEPSCSNQEKTGFHSSSGELYEHKVRAEGIYTLLGSAISIKECRGQI
jgi:hypothetical protein